MQFILADEEYTAYDFTVDGLMQTASSSETCANTRLSVPMKAVDFIAERWLMCNDDLMTWLHEGTVFISNYCNVVWKYQGQ
jgi:hypothetical protein